MSPIPGTLQIAGWRGRREERGRWPGACAAVAPDVAAGRGARGAARPRCGAAAAGAAEGAAFAGGPGRAR